MNGIQENQKSEYVLNAIVLTGISRKRKKCKIQNCDRNRYSKGLCLNHYERLRKFGDPTRRTQNDRNEIHVSKNSVCTMNLYNKNQKVVATTIFNDVYLPIIQFRKWCLIWTNYVGSTINGKQITLQELILPPPEGMAVDHKDRNPLNNLRENLRICTKTQNQQNSTLQINNTSGYVGVMFNKNSLLWRAYIYCNKENIHLGYFTTALEAALVRDKKARELHGEFATLNFN